MKEINVAIVAHDGRKTELIDWVKDNTTLLSTFNLYTTGTTGKLVEQIEIDGAKPFEGKVKRLLSGPLGGDQQIGALIAEGKINMLIFFCDNLIVQGHQNDVSALTRLAALYNIAFATNRTTADLLLSSTLLCDVNYNIQLPSCIHSYANRKLESK